MLVVWHHQHNMQCQERPQAQDISNPSHCSALTADMAPWRHTGNQHDVQHFCPRGVLQGQCCQSSMRGPRASSSAKMTSSSYPLNGFQSTTGNNCP